ncbi:Hypothetical predicted protein [Pelobates cultripes]|uniref:Uncharacterized protein n=1 Tax=Pelobates cultripes TaxID=61616 RepID=A0AAD1VI73_PELCU|nr:Hypothetical predicted protein [Pelobates cultripes]
MEVPTTQDGRRQASLLTTTESTLMKLDRILEDVWRKIEERQRRANSHHPSHPAVQRHVPTTQRRNGFAPRTRPERSAPGGKSAHGAPPQTSPSKSGLKRHCREAHSPGSCAKRSFLNPPIVCLHAARTVGRGWRRSHHVVYPNYGLEEDCMPTRGIG